MKGESESLLPLQHVDVEDTSELRARRRIPGVAATLALVLLVVNGVFDFNGKEWTNHFMGSTSLEESEREIVVADAVIKSNLEVTAHNDAYSPLTLDKAYPISWRFVAEPYRTTQLRVKHSSFEGADKAWWHVTQNTAGAGQEITLQDTLVSDKTIGAVDSDGSATITFSCSKPGTLIVASLGVGRTTDTMFTEVTGVCKYVRREMRQMHAVDREAYLSALAIVHSHTTEQGQAIYGDGFRGVDEMNRQHMTFPDFTGGCTSIHNADSFVSGHTALWRQLEVVLQMIDPTIASPYWDLTIDYVNMENDDTFLTNFSSLLMFNDEWFGSLDDNNRFREKSKYFGKTAIRPRMDDYMERSSYGFTTMLFDNTPDLYVTRASHNCNYPKSNWELQGDAPSCKIVDTCIGATSLTETMICLATDYHQIHFPMGGITNCVNDFPDIIAAANNEVDGWYDTYETEFDTLVYVMYYMMMDSGEDHTISCPASCTIGETAIDDCRCVRVNYTETVRSGKDSLIEFFEGAYSPDSRDPSSNWNDDVLDTMVVGLNELSYETILMLMDTLFNLGTPSSFMPPYAASVEPFFWAVHENLERMWVYPAAHMEGTYQGFNMSWKAGTEDALCNGHKKTDKLSMPKKTQTRAFNGEAFGLQDHDEAYTNEEIINLFWPTKLDTPYIYDSIQFDECGSRDADDAVEYQMHDGDDDKA